jgi:hypothetical protein
MCKWAATVLYTAQCKNYGTPDGPHQYQDREIWPCRWAKKVRSSPEQWEPCEDFIGRHGEAVEQGSFSNRPCPVCRTLEEARGEYDEAIRLAEARYQRAVANSTMVTHYVSVQTPSKHNVGQYDQQRFDKPRYRK